jgi:hypothetical protein
LPGSHEIVTWWGSEKTFFHHRITTSCGPQHFKANTTPHCHCTNGKSHATVRALAR